MDLKYLAILLTAAFLPPILYAVWIRNTEVYNREKWKPIFLAFLWGATVAVIFSLILEILLEFSLPVTFKELSLFGISITLFFAPFAEELFKPMALSLRSIKRELIEPEDGLIYGAVAGLGFSATENLFYGSGFLKEGLFYFFVLMFIRSFGACLLHASATALTGYGYGKAIMSKTSLVRVLPFFVFAMIAHAFYNGVLTYPVFGPAIGLLVAMVFAAIAISFVRKKIRTLDSQGH